MTNTITVQLCPDELKTAYEYGRKRNSKGFAGDVDIDAEDAHLLGMKGEVAFASHYDLQPDLSINDSGGDAGYDFDVVIGGDERLVDVKATTYINDPWLKVRVDRHTTPSDTYVLAAVDGCQVELHGWAPARYIDAKEPTWKTGRQNYVCEPDELLPMFSQEVIQ